MGPFARADLLRFLDSGKLHPQNRAVSTENEADNRSVAEVLNLGQTPSSATADPARLPPRPDHDVTNPAIHLNVTPELDPAIGIFNVLQSVKERQATSPRAVSSEPGAVSVRGQAPTDTPRLQLMAALALLAIGAAWGLMHYLGSSATPSPSNEAKATRPAVETKPVAAAHPAGAPITTTSTFTPRPAAPIFRPAPVGARIQTRPIAASQPAPTDTREVDRERAERDGAEDRERERELARENREREARDRNDFRDARDREAQPQTQDFERDAAANGGAEVAPAPAPAAPPKGGEAIDPRDIGR